MSGYCPAGKLECGKYDRDECQYEICMVSGMQLSSWIPEVCPYPSRQVVVGPVEPETKLKENLKMVSDLYASGYAACQRDAVEALITLMRGDAFTDYRDCTLLEAKAAIQALRAK